MELYRLCLKSGTFKETPTFIITMNKVSKSLHPYAVPSDKQRYNCDTILQRPPAQPYFSIGCVVGGASVGEAKLLFDAKRPEMPNEKIQIKNNKGENVAIVEVSLLKIQQVVQMPPLAVTVAFGTFEESEAKAHPYLVFKYGELNFQTKSFNLAEDIIEWNETFHFPSSETERILVETWTEVKGLQKFLGVAIIPLRYKINLQHQYDVMLLSQKKGKLKIGVYQDKARQNQDHSMAPLHQIKMNVLSIRLKENVKKNVFLRFYTGKQKFQTIPLQIKENIANWNQQFILVVNSQKEQLLMKLREKDEMQQQIGRGCLQISKVKNRRYEITLLDSHEKDIGIVCIQFYDQNLDIKAQIPRRTISVQVANGIIAKMRQLENRYAPKQALFDYMQQVQNAVQQGLLHVAKMKPENPLRMMGEFLLNYEK